ncbi:hypothetical protein DICPUDRAFT_100004 [Dictyostelium purpureum]|uniref:Uncharacterized protein n=1 Tax=Dictyostelium purpureum TaxID=5786 RepID=F1A4J9_DICPU|nr:uncharacterized protein DICPUDRAFT_100004 [Dictyostelium purpureum]EGC28882.1 hypothetical protein DICPUDRAFT_100004 [Dictyostelium purpureum]|eukprot:XP_003294593.1 hypothetical protein DICPUDRAFT_100004 [Dictyostelium purpureum]
MNSSNNNNNNGNHDQKTSELFYQVFHNKYLFNKIFHFIHSVDLIKYKSINNHDNRIIFRNITSLKFLLNKKLYHLLKCKLEAGEYIQVDDPWELTKSMSLMISNDKDLAQEIFKLLLQSTSVGNICHLMDYIPRYLDVFDEDFIQNTLNETIPLLVLPSMLCSFFQYSTNSKIKLLLDSFYNINKNNNSNNYNNYNNQNKTLEINNNILNSTTNNKSINHDNDKNMIQTTFTSPNEYKNEIIKDIYEFCKDVFQRDRVLQLVLSNKEYYNIHNNNKIDIIDIVFNTISIENQNQLLDMKLYCLHDYVNQNDKNEIDNIINNNKDINRIIKLSEYIRKYLEILFPSYNEGEYYFLKQSPFNFFFDRNISYQLEDLKLILQNNTNNWKKINDHNRSPSTYKIEIEIIKFYFENEKHLKFIKSDIWEKIIGDKFYIYSYKIDKKFCQLIESIQPRKYEIYLIWKEIVRRTKTTFPNDIFTDSIYDRENKKSPGTTTTLLVVKDQHTVDLISQMLEVYKQTIQDYKFISGYPLPKINENTFKFKNVEILKYSNKKIFTLANTNVFQIQLKNIIEANLIDDTLLELPLKNAMETFNLKELKSIFGLTEDNSLSLLFYSYKKPNRPLSYQDITQLTETMEYFIKINCPQGVYYCLDLMPEGDYEHTEKDNRLTCLFNSCEVLTTVFAISIKLLSVHIIKLLINKYHYNADVENKLPNYISSFINVENLKSNRNPPIPLSLYSNLDGKVDFQTQIYDNINIDDVISIIHLIINKSKQLQNKMQNQTQLQSISNIDYENYIFTSTPKVHIYQGEALKIVINILFKILIQSKGEVPLEKIKSTYQFINKSGVTTVQQSTLFSIYYLANKSLTLIKYLLGLPIFRNVRDCLSYNWDGTIFYGKARNTEGNIIFNLNDYIDPEVFSFEYIFGNNSCLCCDNGASCIDIIEKLHQNILNKILTTFKESPPFKTITDTYIQTIKTLFFFQRYDLFLKYLEELELIYNNSDDNIIKRYRFIIISNIIQTGDHTLISTVLNEYSEYCVLSTLGICDLLIYNVENNTNIGQSLIKNEIIINEKDFHPDTVFALHHLIFDDKSKFKFSFNIEPYQIPFKLYQFLLNTYPNNTLLKPSKTIIDDAIKRDNIVFLKQLYQNNLINDDIDNTNNEYNQLLSHLKQKLSEHRKYKYINWLN